MKMDLDEAQRRAEQALLLSKYSLVGSGRAGSWTQKYHKDEPVEMWSRGVQGLPYVRAVIIKQGPAWIGMLSMEIGTKGEFPLSAGYLTRDEKTWDPPDLFKSGFRNRMVRITLMCGRWDRDSAYPLIYLAAIKAALYFLKSMRIGKIKGVLLAAERGELSECTISEALSIAQDRWAFTKEDWIRLSEIWEEVFR